MFILKLAKHLPIFLTKQMLHFTVNLNHHVLSYWYYNNSVMSIWCDCLIHRWSNKVFFFFRFGIWLPPLPEIQFPCVTECGPWLLIPHWGKSHPLTCVFSYRYWKHFFIVLVAAGRAAYITRTWGLLQFLEPSFFSPRYRVAAFLHHFCIVLKLKMVYVNKLNVWMQHWQLTLTLCCHCSVIIFTRAHNWNTDPQRC